MAATECIDSATFSEFVEGIGARGLQQPQTRFGIAHIRSDQRLRDQFRHLNDDFAFGVGDIGGDGACGVKRKTAGEDGEAAQKPLLGLGQQPIAPFKRGAQGTVPRNGRAATFGQQPKPIVEVRRQPPHPKTSTRAAANSIASAIPSSLLQISPTSGASASLNSNSPKLSVARSTKS